MVISSQSKFNSHINQKDLPIKKSKPKDTSSAEAKETAEKSYTYEWQAFKGIVFNRDVNPFAKMAKSFSSHAAKRKEKAEKKKAKNNLDSKPKNTDPKEGSANPKDTNIKNEEK